MNRRIVFWSGSALGLVLISLCGIGCDYSSSIPPTPSAELDAKFNPPSPRRTAQVSGTKAEKAFRDTEERTAILESSVTLIQRAALQPGGKNFELAVKKLNHYFEGTSPSDYNLEPPAREYLAAQLPAPILKNIENRNWSLRDTRHIEDCMMYYGIASRVAGTGEDLDRVRRMFDWVVRQVQLVPPGTLGVSPASPGVRQAVRRAAAGHGHRDGWLLGRACLVVHGTLPPNWDRHGPAHVQ